MAAYLARFKGVSRTHTESDLRCFLTWCVDRELAPLTARRVHIELDVRWMQEVRHFQPSTVSRRLSVVCGFYRTCVLDTVLVVSPAEHVRRPPVPTDSPTLGLGHLQFEAILTAARRSSNRYDFALVAMLGLLGLRIFEATGANITDLGEEHGHRVLRVHGRGDKTVLVPLPPAVGRALDQAVGHRTAGAILLNQRSSRMDRHAATRRLRHLATTAGVRLPRMHPHMLRHTFVTTMLDAGVDLRDVQIAARHADPRTTMRYDRTRQNLDRHPVDVADGCAELGFRIAEKAVGRGLATAAVRQVCATAVRTYGLRSLRASVAVDNAGSRAVLSRGGFVPTGEDVLLAGRRGHRYLLSLVGLTPPKER